MVKSPLILSVCFFCGLSCFAQKNLSPTQIHLHNLFDAYEVEYKAATGAIEKNELKNRFGLTVKSFLVDSMKQQTDTITVKVGRIKQMKDKKIAAQLYSGDIEFRYYGNLEEIPVMQRDSILRFIKTLKRNSTVTVGFIHQKGLVVSNPDSNKLKPLILFAFPVPLHYKSM